MTDKNTNILHTFLYIINQIKIYHWQTFSHPRHIATDSLYEKMNDLIDQFIEVLTGRMIIEKKNPEYRIKINNNKIKLLDITDDKGIELLTSIKNILEKDSNLLNVIEGNTDLCNIRDEMLAIVNKTAYLFSLK